MKKETFNKNNNHNLKKTKVNTENSIKYIMSLDYDFNNYNKILEEIHFLLNNNKLSLKTKSYIKLFYAKTLLEHGKYDLAFKVLKEVEISNNNKQNYIETSALIELAILKRNMEDYNKSEFLLNKAYNLGNDKYAPLELGNFYKLTNDFEKAKYYYDKSQLENLKDYYNLILLINNNQLEEAHKKINTMNNNLKLIRDYLTIKLNISNEIDNSSYILAQLTNYNKEEVLEHIIKHSIKNNNKKMHSIFNKNYDIVSKFNYYSQIISSYNPYNIDMVKTYLIDEFYQTGKLNNFSTNYIKIITDENNNIINMYPALSHYNHDSKKIDKSILNNNSLLKKHIN